jgi:hypothetical protein
VSANSIQEVKVDHATLMRVHAIGQPEHAGVAQGAAFANALASVSTHGVIRSMPSVADAVEQRHVEPSSTANTLARHLDDIERHRVEASLLPGHIARSHESGLHGNDVALAMHRQARLMAAYNLNVMWSAKVVGVTAAAIKQLITAT